MTTIAISSLPVATSMAGADVLPIVQSGVTKQLSKTLLFTSPAMVTPALGTVASGNISACTSTSMTMVTPVLGAATGTSLSLSTTLGVTGVSTLTGGAVVQGLTVGRGLGAISTNSAFGTSALAANTTGDENVAVGYRAMLTNQVGTKNTAVGDQALNTNLGGDGNTAVGYQSLFSNSNGDYNTAVGWIALSNVTGTGNVAIGTYAGTYETGSNSFYVNNQNRTNTAGDKAQSLMYGTFDATPSSQILRVNAAFAVLGITATTASASTIASATTIAPTGPTTFISGAAAVDTITPVTLLTQGGGSITLIPTGAFTWTTAGNIAVAGTAVVNRALTMVYDSGTAKWYPSYV